MQPQLSLQVILNCESYTIIIVQLITTMILMMKLRGMMKQCCMLQYTFTLRERHRQDTGLANVCIFSVKNSDLLTKWIQHISLAMYAVLVAVHFLHLLFNENFTVISSVESVMMMLMRHDDENSDAYQGCAYRLILQTCM